MSYYYVVYILIGWGIFLTTIWPIFFCNVHFLLLSLVVSRFSKLTSIMLYLTLNLSLTCGPICFITPYAPLILLCVVGTALLFVESHLVFYRHSFTPPILFPCLKIYLLIFPRYKYIKVISSIESYSYPLWYLHCLTYK